MSQPPIRAHPPFERNRLRAGHFSPRSGISFICGRINKMVRPRSTREAGDFYVLFLCSSHRGSKSGGTDDKQEITLSRRAKKDEKEKTQKDTPSVWERGISIFRNCQILLSPLDSSISLNRPKTQSFWIDKRRVEPSLTREPAPAPLSHVLRRLSTSALKISPRRHCHEKGWVEQKRRQNGRRLSACGI